MSTRARKCIIFALPSQFCYFTKSSNTRHKIILCPLFRLSFYLSYANPELLRGVMEGSTKEKREELRTLTPMQYYVR